MTTTIFNLIGLIPLFTIATWATGRSMKPWWPTRSVWLTGPVVMALLAGGAYMNHDKPLQWASVGLGWALYRCLLGFSSFGGSMDPQTPDKIRRELLRNVVSALFPLAALIYLGVSPLLAAIQMALFAVFVTGVAVWYGVENKRGKDVDQQVDLLDGLGFAVFVILACVFKW